MNINEIVEELKNCSCGREHKSGIKCVEIGNGVLQNCADIMHRYDFPTEILTVTDKNELKAADGILDILKCGDFKLNVLEFDNLTQATEDRVQTVANAIGDNKGVLSIGSGSCNDICRRAAYLKNKPFAIFATAASMDGFASGTSPITEHGFKITLPARQPQILMGDTAVLAKAPAELKSAGFGDMIAKCIALADWRISALVTGEYYCPKIADITRTAFKQITELADRVTADDEYAAGAIMETLVLTGIAMQFADCVRPASGAEHIVSHYWEIRKLEKGLTSDFHGKKVGVATLYISKLYHDIISHPEPNFRSDGTNWDEVYDVYGNNFKNDILKMNSPTVTSDITPERLGECWNGIREIVREEVPKPAVIEHLLRKAGAPVGFSEIGVSQFLAGEGLKYHAYMRHRLTLTRLLPMTDIKLDYNAYI